MAKVRVSEKFRRELMKIYDTKQEFRTRTCRGFIFRGEIHITEGFWNRTSEDTLVLEGLALEVEEVEE